MGQGLRLSVRIVGGSGVIAVLVAMSVVTSHLSRRQAGIAAEEAGRRTAAHDATAARAAAATQAAAERLREWKETRARG